MLEKNKRRNKMRRIFGLIVGLSLSLSLIATMAFAEPVYTEGVSYQVEVTEDGHVQVRKATRIYKDGVEVGKTYHRHVLTPGADTKDEVQKVKDISAVVWTQDVIDAHEAKIAK